MLIGDLCTKIGSGITPRGGARVYKPSGRPFVRSQNVGWGTLHLDELVFLDEKTHATFLGSEISIGDVFLNITGASIGRSALASNELSGGNVNQHVCILRADPIFLNPGFLNFWLLSELGQSRIESFQAGGNRQGLNFIQIRSLELAAPITVTEQRAIAAALGDADGLIGALETLIAKKRDIKQAAMQQLLTGNTRLPGFEGEWEVVKLGEITRIKTGSRNTQDKTDEGRYPFFVRSAVVERINSYAYDCEAVLIPGEGGIGSIFHYIDGRFDVHQRVYVISDFSQNVSGRFVFFFIANSFGVHAMQNSVKVAVDSLRLPTFQNFEITLPPTKDEQTAIAAVLTDMDAEIAALEARRDKTRAIKQGMMQELLTGRIRLQ
jgi:type I restriction enzyme S subunit